MLERRAGAASCASPAAAVFGHPPLPNAVFIAVDKNPDAASTSMRTLRTHGITTGEALRTSLLEHTQLAGAVDVLIFNPPYVVTPVEEMEGCGISISWAGGRNGRQVVDKFLPQVGR